MTKQPSASASLSRGPHRRKHDLIERAGSFSSLNKGLPETRLATLSEIAELQKWRSDASSRITELTALRDTTQASATEESEQVMIDALEELVEIQELDSKFARRIADLRASPFR